MFFGGFTGFGTAAYALGLVAQNVPEPFFSLDGRYLFWL